MTEEPHNPVEQSLQEPDGELNVTVKHPVTVVSAQAPEAIREVTEHFARGTLPVEEPEVREKRKPKTAILVCHGMGQQVQFSTLNDVVNALVAAEEKVTEQTEKRLAQEPDPGKKKSINVQLIKSGDSLLPRVEMKLADANGINYEVHLYEAYWAALTEGKVTMMDVLKFLFSGGWDGLRYAREPFWRWMFGGPKELPFTKATKIFLSIAALIICSLTVLGFSFLAALTAKLIGLFGLAVPDGQLVNLLVVHVFIFIAALLLAGGILVGVKFAGSNGTVKAPNREPGELPKSLRIINGLSIVLLLLATLPVTISLLAHLISWIWQPPNGQEVFPLAELITEMVETGTDQQGSSGTFLQVLIHLVYLFLWGLAIAAFYFARSFFIRYIGDVAAYISAHKVSKFSELRQQIKEVGLKIARAAYESYDRQAGQLEYDNLLVVGHSLGSVVAYDTLNAMINHDMSQGGSLKVVERTKALITFGSPLDKTAFLFRAQLAGDRVDVRESLAAAVQPMIQSYDFRPERWINIWSRLDWISGKLEYYDDPAAKTPGRPYHENIVQNVEDLDASFPMVAHTEYWGHEIFGDTLFRELMTACSGTVAQAQKK